MPAVRIKQGLPLASLRLSSKRGSRQDIGSVGRIFAICDHGSNRNEAGLPFAAPGSGDELMSCRAFARAETASGNDAPPCLKTALGGYFKRRVFLLSKRQTSAFATSAAANRVSVGFPARSPITIGTPRPIQSRRLPGLTPPRHRPGMRPALAPKNQKNAHHGQQNAHRCLTAGRNPGGGAAR